MHPSLRSLLRASLALSCLALLLATSKVRAAEWYVSPGATSSGTGSISNPWQLQTALNHPSAVKPGDTIWLRGGTYVGGFGSYLNGTAAAPIIVRQYPGERATLDGQGQFDTQNTMFSVRGSYVWFWGFEVMSSNTDRLAAASTSWPTGSDLPRPGGVETDGNAGTLTGIKFINMLVHDTRQGFSLWSNSSDVEVYGCLVYYNGWDAPDRGHGHGIYLQNRTGRKWIRNSISFGNYGDGLQAYGSSVAYLNNFTIERSAFFDNGLPSGGYTDQLLVGGGAITRDDIITENCVYAKSATLFRLGYGAGSANAIVLSNYFGGAQGGIYFTSPSAMTMRSNRFYTPNISGITTSSYPDNTYGTGDPTVNSTFIHRNAYEPNRSHIVVYNWQNLNTVTVDASQSLAPNDRYELRNAMNYFGDVIVGTNTTAGQLVIPMSGRVIAAPMGQAAPASPFPRFGTFLLINLGPTGESQANLAPTISSISNTSVAMDSSTGPLPFTVGDTQTSASSLVVTASSSNTSLVPGANLLLGGSGANRTITVTPASGQSGTATITVSVSDGTLASSSSFSLTVTGPNTAPTISALPAITVSAGTSTGPLGFTVGDTQTAAGSLVVSAASGNPTLIPNANLSLGGSGSSRTLTVTPAAGQTGSATITATVSDGSLTANTSFLLTVTAANTAPTILPVSSVRITSGTSTAPLAVTVGDAENSADSLVLSGVASDQVIVPTQNIVFGGSGANRTVTITPAAGQYGMLMIVLTVSDGSLSATTSFALTVDAPNQPPTITPIAPLTLSLNTSSTAIPFKISDSKTAANKLTLTKASSKTTLLPTSGIVFGGSSTNRTVTITPATGQSGSSTVTITVSDGSLTASTSFLVTVTSTNTAPTLGAVANQTLYAGTSTPVLAVVIGDDQTAAGSLSLTASSSNPTLVAATSIVLGGSGANRTVQVTPVAGQIGSATVTLTVSDGALSTSGTFLVTVNAPTVPPTVSSMTNLTVAANSTSTAIGFTVNHSQVPAAQLTVTGSSSAPTLIPVSGIVFGGSGSSRTVQITPATGQSGSATVTVTVSDGFNTASASFVVTVTAPPANTSSLAYEVETGTLVSPMGLVADATASGGYYLSSATANTGSVSLTLNIPVSGIYIIWCRVRATDGTADSFFVSMDGGAEDVYDTAEGTWGTSWQWTRVNGRNGGVPLTLNPRTFSLSAGTHTLTIRNREANTTIDAVRLTTDSAYVPSGTL